MTAQVPKQVVGSPISPEPFTVLTDVGDSLLLQRMGDNINWHTSTLDGIQVVEVNNAFYYADVVGGELVSSGIRAQNQWARTDDAVKQAEILKKRQAARPVIEISALKGMALDASVPAIGEINVLVILVEFQDKKHSRSQPEVAEMFNGNTTTSVHQFFSQASHGKLNVQFDVAGWYDCSEPLADFSDSKGMYLTGNLVRKAVDLAEADGVDFSKYDNNADGVVDAVMVMHAGLGADHRGETKYVWPHSWTLSGTVNKAVTYDQVKIDPYVIACEMRYYDGQSKAAGIGTFCHELGHALGLPDLYDGTGKSSGLGHWAMMSAGSWLARGYQPGNFCAWSRIQLQWEEAIELNHSDYGNYSIESMNAIPNQVIGIQTQDANEYFLLENRQQELNDAAQPVSGLAIYHVNREKMKLDRNINDNRNYPGIRLVEADFSKSDGLFAGNDRGSATDLFPGPENKTGLGAETNPDSKLFDGRYSGVEIQSIQQINGVVSFVLEQPAPVLYWQNTVFHESYMNDGSIRNKLLVNLQHARFSIPSGTLESSAYSVANLPDDLTVKVEVKDQYTAEVMLVGQTLNHESNHTIDNGVIEFTDDAFSGALATEIKNARNESVQLRFLDASEGIRIYFEDFESVVPHAFPEGWQLPSGNQGTPSKWETKIGSNHTPGGKQGVQFYDKNSQNESFWLVSPRISLVGYEDVHFSFWQNYKLNGAARNKVGISTDAENWTIIYNNHPQKSETWEEAVADVPKSFEGQEIYIGFCLYEEQAQGWFWDDVALYIQGNNSVDDVSLQHAVKAIVTEGQIQLVSENPVMSYRLINLYGQIVKSGLYEGRIPIQSLPKGHYILVATLSDRSQVNLKITYH
jgi:M6 family metalloprotease-like protein